MGSCGSFKQPSELSPISTGVEVGQLCSVYHVYAFYETAVFDVEHLQTWTAVEGGEVRHSSVAYIP